MDYLKIWRITIPVYNNNKKMNSKFNISIFIELTIVNFIMPTTYETFVHNSLLNMSYNAVDHSHISTLENNPIVTFSTNKLQLSQRPTV